jgi:hypothetical protein
MLSWGTGVQSSFVDRHGLTLGTADNGFSRRYTVDKETLPDKLGVGIRWVSKRRKIGIALVLVNSRMKAIIDH